MGVERDDVSIQRAYYADTTRKYGEMHVADFDENGFALQFMISVLEPFYSVFNNCNQFAKKCGSLHMLNSVNCGPNLYRTASVLALLGTKRQTNRSGFDIKCGWADLAILTRLFSRRKSERPTFMGFCRETAERRAPATSQEACSGSSGHDRSVCSSRLYQESR
jgi:hypothetical protein